MALLSSVALLLLNRPLMNRTHRRVASGVSRRMAGALIGRVVTIQTAAGTIEGVVTAVKVQSGEAIVVVGGVEYPTTHILTAAPSELTGPSPSAPLHPMG